MLFKVVTAEQCVVLRDVDGSMEAVRFLRELASNGVKCVEWGFERV